MSADGGGAAERPRAHWIVWLFAIVGVLGMLALILLTAIALSASGDYRPAKVEGAKEVFVLTSPNEIPGTDLLAIDVAATEGSGGSSAYSGSEEDRRNILLVDKATGTSRKLLSDNSRRIVSSRFLSAESDLGAAARAAPDDPLMGKPDGRPRAYYLIELRQRGQEVSDLIVGTLAGGRQGVVMNGVDGIDTLWMHGPTRIGMVVREKLGLYYRIVDIPTLKVVHSSRVAID